MNDDCRYEMILVVEAAEGTPEEGVLRSSEAATADQIAAANVSCKRNDAFNFHNIIQTIFIKIVLC